MPPLPLDQLTVAVGRPRHQAGPLLALLTAAGAEAISLPLIHIEALPHAGLTPDRLGAGDLVLFVSANAVHHSLTQLTHPWPAEVSAVALGQGTAAALKSYGVSKIIRPPGPRYDSEALLALPQLAPSVVAGRRVVIVRGEAGRNLLKESLHTSGAILDEVVCYRRHPVDLTEQLTPALKQRLNAYIVTSSEALSHLANNTEPTWLQQLPIFVPHPRIAETALEKHSLRRVTVYQSKDELVSGLSALKRPKLQT